MIPSIWGAVAAIVLLLGAGWWLVRTVAKAEQAEAARKGLSDAKDAAEIDEAVGNMSAADLDDELRKRK